MAREIQPVGLFIGSKRAFTLMGDKHKNLTAPKIVAITNPKQMGVITIGPIADGDPFADRLGIQEDFMGGKPSIACYCDAVRIFRDVIAGIPSLRVVPYDMVFDGKRKLFIPTGVVFLIYGKAQAIEFDPMDLMADPRELLESVTDIMETAETPSQDVTE